METQSVMTKEAIVTQFLSGFNDPSKIADSFALLTDNYHFTDPMENINSKAEFIELSKELALVLTGVEIKRLAVNGNWVVVNYIFNSSVKGLEINTGNEWFRVEDGKIQESHLIYDASEWRKVLENMKK
ncbi:nuclear transport factor 2 family protein [Aquimarina algiphila]|uniref:Nuclear transport factor 2 family protein n=1 Tax=Aquimarina algiphila TaxID=2047982 RepID=A0A554VNE3_9FLAO|nr:nuclear transport factor 2 family protein [Aquimarina algiphila]TSE09883.1 nuclear transport factor 2 family protein [Aquimarina algiphila]